MIFKADPSVERVATDSPANGTSSNSHFLVLEACFSSMIFFFLISFLDEKTSSWTKILNQSVADVGI